MLKEGFGCYLIISNVVEEDIGIHLCYVKKIGRVPGTREGGGVMRHRCVSLSRDKQVIVEGVRELECE